MKIGLLHYTAAPVPGGVETVIAGQAAVFRQEGHRVTVYCGEGEGEVIPELRRTGAPADALVRMLAPRLAEEEVVMIHNVCTMPFHPALAEALWTLARNLPRVRFLHWVHDLAIANPDYLVADPVFHSGCPAMEYVAVSGHRQRQVQECLGVPCRVIPNGVAVDPFFFPVRDWTLLHPARLLRRKNLEFSLRVLQSIRAAGREAVLLFTAPFDPHQADTQRYREELLQLRRELGLEEHALFLSDRFAPAELDLPRLYAFCDAVLFPSRHEGFGLPVLEAALYRTPIFCPDLEPLRSLLPDGPHLYPPEIAPDELAERIMRQLDGSKTITARRRVLQDYTWGAIHRKFLAPLLVGKQTS